MRFFNRTKFPELAGNLIKGEQVLAWADHSGGKIFATNFALISFDHHDSIRIPWELSLSAKWDEPLLTVNSQDSSTGPAVVRAWQIADPGMVPAAVRERITQAQIFEQIRDLPEVGKVRFLARKGPLGITWSTLTDEAINENSQAHIQAELTQLKNTLGI